MILFGKVLVIFFLTMAAIKIFGLALPTTSSRAYAAADALLYMALGTWGLTEWVLL